MYLLSVPQGGSPRDWDDADASEIGLWWEMHEEYNEAQQIEAERYRKNLMKQHKTPA